jgi:HlyD family secretion protein
MPTPISTYHQELISDEMQEVISYRPHWIVRKGSTFFLLITLSLLGLTWLIKYPDVIKSSAKLVALNPPKLVNAKAEGKLLKLFVKNEQMINKGQELGYIESTSDYNEVAKLKSWITEIINGTTNNEYSYLLKNPLPVLNGLGELQRNYQEFQNQLEITKQTLASGYYQQKKGALQKDLNYIANLKNNTAEQEQLQEQDMALQQKEYDAYKKLAEEKVIAPLELNQYKSKLLAKEQNLKQSNAQLTNNDINSHSKQKEILDLQKQIIDQQQQFHSSLLQLKSDIEKWTQQYVLTAPENGKVLFVSSLQENELISNGQGLFYIQPEQTEFYSELMAGQQGLGKVRVGQRVMIKVNSYPSNEYGYLTGKIDYISNIPNRRDSFLIKVSLQNGLQTNYGKEIFFRNDLLAEAEIITDDRKLFDRLIGQLKQIGGR